MKGIGVLNAFQAAEFLGVHVETVRRLARRHELPTFKVGKDWRFHESKLQHWADTHHIRASEPLILVVDDDAAIRFLVRKVLEPEGCRVVAAADGAEALAAAQRDTPEILILDLKMKGMTGVEVLSQIRRMYPDLPVIILTGYPASNLMVEALDYSPVILLPKPLGNEVLCKTVRQILDGTRRRIQGNG